MYRVPARKVIKQRYGVDLDAFPVRVLRYWPVSTLEPEEVAVGACLGDLCIEVSSHWPVLTLDGCLGTALHVTNPRLRYYYFREVARDPVAAG